MTLTVVLQAAMQPGQIPWPLVGTLATMTVAIIGYFIKQDKQISKQADKILVLEKEVETQEAQIASMKTFISEKIGSLRADIVQELKSQEKETRDLRERLIRMEERILSGMKKGFANKEDSGGG